METVKKFPVDEVLEIQIKSSLSQVNVTAGSGTDIVLRWTDTKRRTTEAALDSKKLSVKDHGAITLYGIIGLIQLKADKELTLELPSEFRGNIQIESTDENVRVIGVTGSCSLRVKTTVGAIDISATDIQHYDLNSQSGAVTMHSVKSGNGIRVSTNNGNIDCFCVEDASAYLLDCHTEHGKCSLPSVIRRGGKMINIRSRTGNITVGFMDEKGNQA